MSSRDAGVYWVCRCGAMNDPEVASCWICGAAAPQASSPVRAPTTPVPVRTQFTIATLLLYTTLCAVVLGLFVALPGLGIVVALAILPPLVRTTLLVRRRSAAGHDVPMARRVALFTASLATTMVIAAAAIPIAFGTFCAVCLVSGTEKAIPVAILVGVVSGLGVVGTMSIWVLHRWRRDVERG